MSVIEPLEVVITAFIDLKISIDVASSDAQESASSEQILAHLDRVYALQRKLKTAIQRKLRQQLAQLTQVKRIEADAYADEDVVAGLQAEEEQNANNNNNNSNNNEADDAFPIDQLRSILADMDDIAVQLDQRLVAREARTPAPAPAPTAPASPAVVAAPPVVVIQIDSASGATTATTTTRVEQHNAVLPSVVVPSPESSVGGVPPADADMGAGAQQPHNNPLLSQTKDAVDDWSGWGALEINPNEIRFDPERDFLGKGSFGRVYAGRCRGKEVAVKVPVKQQLSDKDLAAFRHEVLIMSKIYHPNVVLFMGASTSPGNFRIVSELLHTDLERLLRSEQTLLLHDRARMAKDAALGMNWLHGISGIIHRDLKPANLLVDSNFTVKLTDFGFAQLRPEREDETLTDCFDAVDHQLLTNDGFLFLDEVLNRVDWHVRADGRVAVTDWRHLRCATFDGATVVYVTPNNLSMMVGKQRLFELTNATGICVVATANHNMYIRTRNSNVFARTRVDDLVKDAVDGAVESVQFLASACDGECVDFVAQPAARVTIRALPEKACVTWCFDANDGLVVVRRAQHSSSAAMAAELAAVACAPVSERAERLRSLHRAPSSIIGLSRATVQGNSASGAKGTPLWMAPEIMMGKPFTEKVDVYAFGIILWQILTRQEPFAHHRNLKLFRVAVCKRSERPPMPPDAPPRLRCLIEDCWNGEATRRPPFKRIVRQLDDVLLDAVVDDPAGAEFWRAYFGRGELRTAVPWREFALTLLASVSSEIGTPNPLSDSADFTSEGGDAKESSAATTSLMPADKADEDAFDNAANQLAFFQSLLASRETQRAKGESLVVTMQRFSTNIKWFGRFFEPGAHGILETVKVLQSKPWFHGDVTKEESEARLSCRMDGTFLVRLSATTPGCPYTISMINNQHRRILHEGVGKPYFVKGSAHAYTSLAELIETCRELSLVVPCPHNVQGWGYVSNSAE